MPVDEVIFFFLYANKSEDVATNEVITNPIPAHMNYENGSAQGTNSQIEFSVDGSHFATPDKLTVTVDGRTRHAQPETTPTCVGPWRSRWHPDNKGNCRIGQCWSNDRDSGAVQDIRVYGDTAKKQDDKAEVIHTMSLTGEIYAQANITPDSVGRAVGRIGHRRHISIGTGGWHTAGHHDQQQRLG